MDYRESVSIMKAAELVGVSRRTLYNWMAAGKVEYTRTAGGSIRIFTDSLWQTEAQSEATADRRSQQRQALVKGAVGA